MLIFVTSHLSNDFCQAGIAHDQPAARGDAVGLVLELLGVYIIKVLKPGDKILFSGTECGNIVNSFNITLYSKILWPDEGMLFISASCSFVHFCMLPS